MSPAEILAAALAAALAAVPLAAYLMNAAGLALAPTAVLACAVAAGGTTAAMLWRGRERETSDRGSSAADVAAWLGVVVAVTAWLLALARPDWLPPGRGSDLTHHLLLVDYIERHHTLVRDLSLGGAMGEMAFYTPGAHVLAVLAGAWSGTDGLTAFYPLLAATTAMSAAAVFLIARRLALPVPFALAAALLLFLPIGYFAGTITHDGFLAQALSAYFTVAAWWTLVAWDARPSAGLAALFGLLAAAVFLAWPMWIGPPVLVFVALLAGAARPSIAGRWRYLVLGLTPLAVVGMLHVVDRWGWLAIAGASGFVAPPSLATLGWVFPLLAAIGLARAVPDRRARVTVVFALVIAVQAVTLFVVARANGADTPYMAFKMMYLLIYPLALCGAVAVHAWVPLVSGSAAGRVAAGIVGWAIATLLVVTAVRPAINAPRQVPVVSRDLYDAGRWAREQLGPSCADYLVADAETAYWLHLAVLGNPRATPRTAEVDRYDARAAIGRWLSDEGPTHAIADWRLIPEEVRARVEVLARFGGAAVVRRPGAAPCGSP